MPEFSVGGIADAAVRWSQVNLAPLFDAISAVMLSMTDIVLMVLTAPHPLVITALATGLAFWARGVGLAIFSLLGLLLVQYMELWPASMLTLAVVLVSSFLALLVGIPLGILAANSAAVKSVLRPLLDIMQTLPAFVYLIPAVFLFGIGLVPAVVATFIFAIPPAVRLTDLGIRQVDREMVEASAAFGATRWQVLRGVQLPLAVPSIMAGVNQVIMMSLSMVVIAGLVGAGGLGSTVVTGISRLDIGAGFEGGIAVVFLAMYLDRVTSAFPRERKQRRSRLPIAKTGQPAPEPTPAIAQPVASA